MKKSKIVKIIIVIVLVVAIVTGTVIYVVKKTDKRYEAVIMGVATGDITQTLSTTGTVESQNRGEFEIFDGVVAKEVLVKIGDKVKDGQLLATFEPSSLNGIVTQKQTNFDTAKINYYNSQTSAKDAKAKIPQVEAQIAELEAQVKKLSAVVDANKKADGTAEKKNENVPAWVDKLDYSTLAKLLGGNYTEQQLRDFFAQLALRGTSQSTLKKLIDNMTTLSSFDMTSMFGSSTEETELMSAKVNLIGLKAQKTLLETQAQNILESTYKSLMDTAQTSLDETKSAVTKLAKGWYATGDGIVSEINVSAGKAYESGKAVSSFDLSSVIGNLANVDSTDLSSIISSLSSSKASKNVGLAVEYYDSFVASFSLGKYDVVDVKVGQKAKVNSIGHEFEGEVSYISPVATAGSGLDIGSMLGSITGGSSSGGSNTIPAQIVIKNPDTNVIIGVDVDIDIDIATQKGVVVVPIEAVQSDATGDYIFKFNPDSKTVSKVQVTLGLASDTEYQIVSGCKAGEKIVQNQSTTLEDGAKVKVKPAEETTK